MFYYKLQKLIFFASILVLIESCGKEHVAKPVGSVTPTGLKPIDTLKGKEFIFSDLTWNYWIDDFNEIYTSIENRPDLFNAPSSSSEIYVYVKSVTDTSWVTAKLFNNSTAFNGYAYNIYMGGLYVFPYPLIFQGSSGMYQAGTKVALKLKFL